MFQSHNEGNVPEMCGLPNSNKVYVLNAGKLLNVMESVNEDRDNNDNGKYFS